MAESVSGALRPEPLRIVLASRPKGAPVIENFRLERFALPSVGKGELLLKVEYLSIDPYMRVRMSAEPSYAPPLELGDPMPGHTVGRVLESRHPDFAPGNVVLSYSGWQSHAVTSGAEVRKLDPDVAPVTAALGVYGMPGFTAYCGLLALGRPESGETVVVASAAGPVGSAVGQIARIKGARAVGIAGGPQKCALLLDRFGFDAAVDHRSPSFAEDLRRACPDGIDVYFENVGGAVLEAVFPLFNLFSRMPVCGLAAQYNDGNPFSRAAVFPAFLRQVMFRSVTVRGFLQTEFEAEWGPSFRRDMADWLRGGRVRYLEDIVDGIENAPAALIRMLDGGNVGKLIVRL